MKLYTPTDVSDMVTSRCHSAVINYVDFTSRDATTERYVYQFIKA